MILRNAYQKYGRNSYGQQATNCTTTPPFVDDGRNDIKIGMFKMPDIHDADLMCPIFWPGEPPAYRRFAGAIGWVFLVCCFSRIISAIPLSMAADANTKRRVMGSPRITMAPKAAMTGTLRKR